MNLLHGRGGQFYQLSSGKMIRAKGGYLAINPALEIATPQGPLENLGVLSASERMEIALYMIMRWREWAESKSRENEHVES